MKILNVMPYSPVPPDFGGALREYHLLQSLVREHEVTVLTFGDEKQYRQFDAAFGDRVEEIHMVPLPFTYRIRRLVQAWSFFTPHSFFYNQVRSREMQRRIDDLLGTGRFDAVHCEFTVMGSFDYREAPLQVMDTHNVEYENFRTMWKNTRSKLREWFYRREYQKVYQEEIDILKKQDIVFSTSEADRDKIQDDVPDTPIVVVPNGVDTSYFVPASEAGEGPGDPRSIVFTGMMGYTPNHDGMMWFLDEIYPLILRQEPEAKVYIVGKDPHAGLVRRQSDRVIVTGWVEDVRPYVWKSGVFVVPLRMGSGTRLKVVEALSMKVPVVSTRLGCEGIDVEHGRSILVEDTPRGFADSVVRLMREPEERKRLTENGSRLVHEKYDWTTVGERMLESYRSLEGRARSAREVPAP